MFSAADYLNFNLIHFWHKKKISRGTLYVSLVQGHHTRQRSAKKSQNIDLEWVVDTLMAEANLLKIEVFFLLETFETYRLRLFPYLRCFIIRELQ